MLFLGGFQITAAMLAGILVALEAQGFVALCIGHRFRLSMAGDKQTDTHMVARHEMKAALPFRFAGKTWGNCYLRLRGRTHGRAAASARSKSAFASA